MKLGFTTKKSPRNGSALVRTQPSAGKGIATVSGGLQLECSIPTGTLITGECYANVINLNN